MSMALLPSLVTSHPYLILLAISLVIPISILIHDIFTWSRLPLGPIPLPFIGNKFQIPKTKPWLQFQQWSYIYGPIFTLWIGRQPTLIISDPNIAVEVLEKRSNKYSSRPRMVVMGEVYNNYASILTQPYGKAWSVRRRLLHQALSPPALKLYKPTQEAEATRLCHALLTNSAEWEREIERFTASVVFCVAYGKRIDSLEAKVIKERFKFMTYMSSLNIPGKFLAECLPILAKLPNWLARWKTEVQAIGAEEGNANLRLLEMVKHDLKSHGSSTPDSLSSHLLTLQSKEKEKEKAKEIPLTDLHLSYLPASLFGAGSDTTASTLCTSILALLTHPHSLQRAYAELSYIIGPNRLPTFADEPYLPYLRALVKETLRWRPVAVLGGTPHATSEADVYRGWSIPAGTTVLCNSWAINTNAEYYPDPHTFDPGRFLSREEGEGKVQVERAGKPHPSPTGHSSFGWGRRICPGAGLATNTLFITLAKLIWTYDILPLVEDNDDEEGQEDERTRQYDIFAYTNGFNIRPERFACVFKVRSPRHREVLEGEMGGAREWLGRFGGFEDEDT